MPIPPIKPLKDNPNLFVGCNVRQNSKRDKKKVTLHIVSGLRYQGYIKLSMFSNGKFGKNVHLKKQKGYQDEFTILAETIEKCDNIEDLVLLLTAHGFSGILNANKTISEAVENCLNQYHLLTRG